MTRLDTIRHVWPRHEKLSSMCKLLMETNLSLFSTSAVLGAMARQEMSGKRHGFSPGNIKISDLVMYGIVSETTAGASSRTP